MAGLRLEHIYKVYPNGTKAVSDFTMDIKDQEFIVFVGPSGCGKSTTLRMIAGLEDITAGELYIDDRIVNEVEPKDRDIAMVFQNYALYPHMTVYENMAFGLKLRHVPNAEIHKKVLWAANILDLVEYLDRKPRAMSGGQRQRVALGRAILRNPKVMLLDEPLSNLDAKLRAQMRSEISKLHDELKTTFIYVTHDQVEAMTLGSRVVVMKLGKIMQVDTPKNLYDYPENLFVAGFIGTPQMNFFEAKLNKNGNKVTVDFQYSDNKIEVPYSQLAKVQPQYFNNDTIVKVGLRCENISCEPEVVAKSKSVVDVKISHFEELGNETLIYGDINMQGDGFQETSTRIIIKGTSDYGFKKGDIVKAAMNLERAHFFDKNTEQTINPRVPTTNLVSAKVNNGSLIFDTIGLKLPKAISIPNGDYEVVIPSSAIKLSLEGDVNVVVENSYQNCGYNIANIKLENSLLFAITDELIQADNKWYISLDYTQISFNQNGKTVYKSLPEYDKIDAVFINHSTAKSFVGDKFDAHLAQRIQDVKDKYEPQLNALTEEYNVKCSQYQNVNSAAILAQYAPLIKEKEIENKKTLESLNNQLKEELKASKIKHVENNKKITQEVNDLYAGILEKELAAFNSFKEINKDKEVYRKRAQDLREFKINQELEKKNEMERRINLEAINYETEINSLKGNFKRTKDNLKKNYTDLDNKAKNEAYPLRFLEKEYNKNVKSLKEEYKKEATMASILFYFKINDYVTLSPDIITNKMIQGLGVNVFTKQYLIELPHDAYYFSETEGLEFSVLEELNYGDNSYLHCVIHDGTSDKDAYVLVDKSRKDYSGLKIAFDVAKVHITEKGMDIKIY